MVTTSRPENFAEAQALAHLETRCSTSEKPLTSDTAIAYLVSVGFVRTTAIDCLTHLRQQGYLYESESGLRLLNLP